MIPQKLMLRNFMCYRDEVPPLDLQGISIACLSGENGSGKSALLDAITWALWGQARLKSDDDLIAQGAQEMEVELIFALDGQEYRVIRKRSKARRTGQSWLDFQVRHDQAWKSLTGGTLRETQQQILATLRMDYEIFSNSAYLRQGHADEFTRKEPSRRKQVLADILGLDAFETYEARAKEKSRSLDGDIKVTEGRIDQLERQAERRDYLMELVTTAELRVEELQQVVDTAEKLVADLNSTIQRLEARKTQRDEITARLNTQRNESDDIAREIGRLKRAIEAAQTMVARSAEIMDGLQQLQQAQVEFDQLDAKQAQYETLQQQRTEQDRAIHSAEQKIQSELRFLQSSLQNHQQQLAKRPRLQADLERHKESLAGFSNITNELDRARARRAELSDLSQEIHRIELQRVKLDSQIKQKHDSLVATREELKRRIREAEKDLRDEAHWRQDLERLKTQQTQLEAEQQRLVALRQEEKQDVERSGALRAACETIKAQGEDTKQKLAMLSEDQQSCPLCGSELGHNSLAHITEEYERQIADLRAQYSNSLQEAKGIERELEAKRTEIQNLERKTAGLNKITAEIALIEQNLQKAQELTERRNNDQREVNELDLIIVKGDYEPGLRAELKRFESQLAGLGNSNSIAREISTVEQRVSQLEAKLNEQAAIRTEIDSIQRQLRELESDEVALHDLEEQITQVKTTLDLQDFAKTERQSLAHIDREISKLGYTPELHRAARATVRQLEHWQREHQQLQTAEQSIANDTRALEHAEELLKRRMIEIESLESQLGSIEQELRALGPTIRQLQAANDDHKIKRRELSVCERDLGERRAELRRAEADAEELKVVLEQRKNLIARKELFDELIESFGKKGVQAMLIETAIPEIEREANELLGRMTDNQMHLTFETQRETKKGDVSETLDIRIADALGTRTYDAFSGGESFRLNFAIRVALSKLLAKRAGARLETLIIDEGFGTQDSRGRERLVEAITSVQGDFKKILVVTHIQELKDLFPVQIEVSKTSNGSRWAIN